MKTFLIDSANCAKAYASSKAAQRSKTGTEFASGKDFASISTDWPLSRFVAIWNKLPGVKPVRKFTDRSTALSRIWTAVQDLAPGRNTKSDIVIGLLKRPGGATLQEIMGATGWQAHSVRGFISGQLTKRLGLRVISSKREGERVYRVR